MAANIDPRIATVSASILGLLGLLYLSKRRKAEKWVKVGTLDSIHVYPFKGGKGHSIPTGFLSYIGVRAGPFLDRSFLLIDESGVGVTLKEFPKFVLLEVSYDKGSFQFNHPDIEEGLAIGENELEFQEEKLIQSTLGVDKFPMLHCGQKADDWFNKLLDGLGGKSYKLVYHYKKTALREVSPKYAPVYPEHFKPWDSATANFSSPLSLITQSTIEAVSTECGTEVNPQRYRCNLVVRTSDGKPYQEDSWKNIKIGSSLIHFNKPCNKCVIVNVDPVTGEKDDKGGLLKKLYDYRFLDLGSDPELAIRRKKTVIGPPLSINCGLDQEGYVHVGDEVFVLA